MTAIAGSATRIKTSAKPQASPWRAELNDLVRAASGGMLFGVPLLYTMEVWWIGSHTRPEQTAVVLAFLAIPVFALNLTEGFRSKPDPRFWEAAADTVEAVAIGLVITAIVLILLREIQIGPDIATGPALGKVLYEAAPFCLGIGVARHFLDGATQKQDDQVDNKDYLKMSGTARGESTSPTETSEDEGRLNATLADLGAATIGSVFIALSIAPTDEVPMIASRMGGGWLLLAVAASLISSYAIVFAAGFSRQESRHAQEGIFQSPLSETVASYLVALVISAFLLWFFQRDMSPVSDLFNRVIVLGFPAAVGGAAGRLAI
ncbi:MAG: TIGR02587 family membrane protein [Acidimicrobiia bacterium]